MIGGVFFTLMATLIKYVGSTSSLHVTEILFVRQLVVIFITLPLLARNFPQAFQTSRRDLHAVRIVCSFLAVLLGFTAIIHLPLSDSITLSFSRTIFITILSIFILSETVGIRRWGAVIVGMVGVLIVLRPTGVDSLNFYGILAVLSALLVAMQRILIKILSRSDQPVTLIVYQAIGTLVLLSPFAFYYWIWPTFEQLILLILIGVLTIIAQTMNIFAYRIGEASLISILDYLRLLYAILLGAVVFGELPSWNVLVGGAIIILASIYTIRRAARRRGST